MKIDAKLLSLLGLMVIVGIFGLGIAAIGLPMYEGVQRSQAEIAEAQQNNATYEARLIELESAKSAQGEIEASIAKLREELPASVDSASIADAIGAAMTAHGLIPTLTTVGKPVPFTPRTDPLEEGAAPVDPAPDTAADTDAAEAVEAAEDVAAGEAGEASAGAPAEAPGDPRQQSEIVLEVKAPDQAAAVAFLDALGRAKPLLLVTATDYQPDDTGTAEEAFVGKLLITMTTFHLTEQKS
ncbi:hypothetical protein ACXR2W_08750 [Leucobacter sp. HY1908]